MEDTNIETHDGNCPHCQKKFEHVFWPNLIEMMEDHIEENHPNHFEKFEEMKVELLGMNSWS